ncbi:MAG TPA: drug/metabolite exporter YedA [Kofleriaceae bacterium]|nr:drug/metabolite exporter YedA [Kofleriaceae bacterium]
MSSSPAALLPDEPMIASENRPGSPPHGGPDQRPGQPGAVPSPVGLRRALIPLAAVYIIWGSTYLGIRIALEGFPPLALCGIRFAIAGGAILLFLAARGAALPDRRQWLSALPIGALLFVGGNGFVALAEVHIGSGVAAVVVATMPLWMGLFAALAGERPRAREWVGIGLGFAAVAVLSSGGDLRADLGATLFLLLSPVAWSSGSMLSRRAPRAPGGFMAVAASQMLIGGILALALGLATGERFAAMPGPRPLLAMVYLTAIGTLGFVAYSWLLRHVRPVLATSYAFVNPLLAVVLGTALGGEALGWSTIVAAPAVALAVALAITARGR